MYRETVFDAHVVSEAVKLSNLEVIEGKLHKDQRTSRSMYCDCSIQYETRELGSTETPPTLRIGKGEILQRLGGWRGHSVVIGLFDTARSANFVDIARSVNLVGG